jgi:hypothetical protein
VLLQGIAEHREFLLLVLLLLQHPYNSSSGLQLLL